MTTTPPSVLFDARCASPSRTPSPASRPSVDSLDDLLSLPLLQKDAYELADRSGTGRHSGLDLEAQMILDRAERRAASQWQRSSSVGRALNTLQHSGSRLGHESHALAVRAKDFLLEYGPGCAGFVIFTMLGFGVVLAFVSTFDAAIGGLVGNGSTSTDIPPTATAPSALASAALASASMLGRRLS